MGVGKCFGNESYNDYRGQTFAVPVIGERRDSRIEILHCYGLFFSVSMVMNHVDCDSNSLVCVRGYGNGYWYEYNHDHDHGHDHGNGNGHGHGHWFYSWSCFFQGHSLCHGNYFCYFTHHSDFFFFTVINMIMIIVM